ncbi:hypothetical protein ABZ927_39060 [Streptomyces massasporeus]|uniref:hypothetical protein n=1 Tax=Micromonospora arborensis TaxID=2116518 RepID=UPI00343D31A9
MRDETLAATVAGLLLVGGTLILRELVGVWPAAGVGMGLVLTVGWAPALARRIRVAHQVRRFGRHLATWDRERVSR